MKIESFFEKNKDKFQESELMSESADKIFESRLKDSLHVSKEDTSVFTFRNWSIAASIAVLVSIGIWYSTDDSLNPEEQELLMADLTNDSAGKRLEGVYHFNETFRKEDNRILERLIEIVLNDENANVQIASIDALLKFPKNEKVRKNLIKALETENKPIVQIKLIKAIQTLRDNRAQESLEKIIENEQTFPIVKSNATLAMASLKNK